MYTFRFDISPYTFNSIALVIIGIACVLYLLRVNGKSRAIWLMTIAMSSFTLSMACMLASGIVYIGSIFVPFIDTFAVISMIAIIEFCYAYPHKIRSVWFQLIRYFVIGCGILALYFSVDFSVKYFDHSPVIYQLPTYFWFFNPLAIIIAFFVCIGRTIDLSIQPDASSKHGIKKIGMALYRPAIREARVLRNYALALSFGLIQGFASSLGLAGQIPALLGAFLINISLLLMGFTIVYASFELLPKQPGLIVRLAGLVLITLLVILGLSGMYNANITSRWVVDEAMQNVEIAQKAIRYNRFDALPTGISYIIEGIPTEIGSERLLYADQIGFDSGPLLEEIQADKKNVVLPKPIWAYYLESVLKQNIKSVSALFRYGSHPQGSYHEYIAYHFMMEGKKYEVGILLQEMSKPIQMLSLGLVWTVLLSSLFVLVIIPGFLKNTLITPLEKLLSGIRHADAGDLNVMVAPTHDDEIGFLTKAFNQMTVSLNHELGLRKAAESNLLELNQTLEQRVANRTHELEALYDVSAAASQAHELHTLLSISLQRIMVALKSTHGMIYLLNEDSDPELIEEDGLSSHLRLATSLGIPDTWLPQMAFLFLYPALIDVILLQHEPILISDIRVDARVPEYLQLNEPLTMILAPLQAQGKVLGILGLFRDVDQDFKLDEVAVLTSIASQVGVAVQTEHFRQRAQTATILEDRQRLTRDLHDSVIQSLYGLVTLTEAGKIRVEEHDFPAIAQVINRIGQTARQAIREIRLFIHQLRPPILEQEGLVNALEQRLAAVEGRSDVQVSLHIEENIKLPISVETELFYIAQEALNNTLKHARATTILVSICKADENVILKINDNGCGFDPLTIGNAGMGLISMGERAELINGRLEIRSQPDEGTIVSVTIKENEIR